MARRGLFSARHLCAVLLFCAARLCAQDFAVSLRGAPESPLAETLWTLTLLVGHPLPDEVEVQPPVFDNSFFPDKTVKSLRITGDAETAERQTEFVYTFFPGNPGVFPIGPFTVITPAGSVQTEPFEVNVRAVSVSAPRPVLRWAGPSQMRVGESASFRLMLSGWDFPYPPARLFAPPLRDGVIIETEEPAAGDVESSVALRLTLLPLKAAPIVFPARTIVYENVSFRIPALSITVIPARPSGGETASAAASPQDSSAGQTPDSAAAAQEFPAFETPLTSGGISRLFFRLGGHSPDGDYANIYHTAKNFWDRGYHADALALLRQNERDHILGPAFFPLRKQAEEKLDLRDTKNEKSRIVTLGVSILCLTLFFTVAIIYTLKSRRKKRPPLFVMLIFAALVLFFAVLLYRTVSVKNGGNGTLRETEVRLVPDLSGEPVARLQDGQPVKINVKRIFSRGQISWIWIETADNKNISGWIPEERAIRY